ncbi:MAG: cobalt ECF transporter T component CbiQ [Clostridia bacterium]|jgi:cobalt/nickel transport system permease protein|nr:cobalt ECF transporter T component CbiQ [Clostridia bacterium]
MIIDSYAYSSKIKNQVPKNKIFFGTIPLFIVIGANSFSASMIILIIMSIMSLKCTNITFKKYLKLLSLPTGFLIIGVLTIIITKHDYGIPVLFGITIKDSVYGVDKASIIYGSNLMLRALAAVSCMYFMSLTTPMNDVLFTLKKLKISAVIISLMELIYRYIFVLLEEAGKIKTAQASRLGYINLKTSIKSIGTLLAMLFLRTYIRCDNVYAALESRGYDGEFKTIYKEYENDYKWIIATIVLSVILVVISILERRFY